MPEPLGLTSEEAAQLARQGKANVTPSKSSMNVAQIVARNVLTYFNAIFAALAAQVVLLDSDFSHMRQIVSEGRRDINNITRSATLFLYKNIFSFALALFAIFGAFVYPLTPNQVSLVSVFNIGLPAFLLTFEPNEKKQEGTFIATVLMRSVPAALTTFVAIACMMLFAELFGISAEDVSVASTYLLSVVGFLILAKLVKPPNRYRIAVFALCVVGLFVVGGVFWELFDIYAMSPKALVLCVVFGLAEVGVLRILNIAIAYARRMYQTSRGV